MPGPPASPDMVRRLFDPTDGFKASRGANLAKDNAPGPARDALAAYSILGGLPEVIASAKQELSRLRSTTQGRLDPASRALDRGMGCVLGNTIGDALGAPLEFSDLRYGSTELTGLCDDEIWDAWGYNKFRVKPGQWTDDTSMALCIADSLLCCGKFDGIDLRQRFHLWNQYGYNNAFGRDARREMRSSIGLGGNIDQSMTEWEWDWPREPYTKAGDMFTSGNGSAMRNSPIPVWFRGNLEAGMDAAVGQSRSTHAGEEAAEVCRLLTYICWHFINGSGKELLEDLSGFNSPLYTVTCLARSRCEERHEQNSHPVFGDLENRRWDWQSPNHRYCARRAQDMPGYIGSYAMDCMSMALHCVHSTGSFEEATLKAANLRGDSDSVCAVAGQLAGALYGASAIPKKWLERVEHWDGGSIAGRAYLLHQHRRLDPGAALSEAACATAQLLGRPHRGHEQDLEEQAPSIWCMGLCSACMTKRPA